MKSTVEFAFLWPPNAMADPTGAAIQAATWEVRRCCRYRGSFACLTTAYLQAHGQVLSGHGPVLVCDPGLPTHLILPVDLCFLPTNLTNLPTSLIFIHCQSNLLLYPTAIVQFSSVQFISVAQSCPILATPWIAARQAFLFITISRNSLRLTSIESVMPSSHLILGHPLLLLPPIPPSIRVFSNESTLHMRWTNYWSFSFSIIPSKEIPGLISFRMDWLDLPAVQGTFSNTTVQMHQFFGAQPSPSSQSKYSGLFPLTLTDLISLISKWLSRVFSSITVQKYQFLGVQPILLFSSHICIWLLEKP